MKKIVNYIPILFFILFFTGIAWQIVIVLKYLDVVQTPRQRFHAYTGPYILYGISFILIYVYKWIKR